VNVVGDHATYHQKFDAPLESDIDALGKWVHGTVHRPASTAELGAAIDAALAATTLGPGRIATLVLPADLSWSEAESGHLNRMAAKSGSRSQDEPDMPRPGYVDVTDAAALLKSHGDKAVLLLGGSATSAAGLRAAARISAATGARALVETFPARLARGQGVPNIPRLGYFAEMGQEQLRGARHLIWVG